MKGRAANFSQALAAGGHTINPTEFAHFVMLFNILTSMPYDLYSYIAVSYHKKYPATELICTQLEDF